MLKKMPTVMIVFCFAVVLALGGCGGSGGGSGDSSDTSGSIGVNSGVLVDPYIVGAQLQELRADDQIVIQSSAQSVTDASGRFSFANDFGDGSLLQISLSTRGTHAGVPFNGIIKRQVFTGDAGPIVVSPLTTLLANGMSPTEVIQLLSGAGLTGLSEDDLYSDPMSGLVNKAGNITNADLVLLQANMAAYAFMEAIQDFNYDGSAMSADLPVTFDDCVFVIRETLNPNYYQQMAGAIGNDFTVGDLANTTVIVTRTVVDEIKNANSGSVSPETIDQFMSGAMAGAETIAGNFYQSRMGSGSNGGDAPAADPASGEAIVTANGCTGCHTIGSGSGLMELANDGSKLSSKFAGSGHQGIALSDAEISDVAAYLNASTSGGGGTSSPPVDTSCNSCHGYPPTTDAHTTHLALNGVDCDSCHLDNIQNGDHQNDWVDLNFPAELDAASGPAIDNGDLTCSNIICHGGQETPEWGIGSIDVNTQCISCHQRETAQYNSYSSGEHGEHRNYACTVCHNTAKMTGHFGDLSTAQFETDPATTIGGGTTRVGSYDGTSCSSIDCHDSEPWEGD